MSSTLFRFIALAVFLVGAWKLIDHTSKWRTWTVVPATVESVTIEEIAGDPHPNLKVMARYRFRIGEKEYVSEQLDFFGGDGYVYSEPAEADAKAEELRDTPPETCRVHPDDPSQSALIPEKERDTGIALTSIGLVLILIGLWEPFVGFWRRRFKATSRPSFLDDVAPALGFALLMTVPIIALGIAQGIEESEGADWVETPARVIESELVYTDEWVPSVLYEWSGKDGQTYRSRRISFAMYYGSVISVERFLKRYPAGGKVVCYINPDEPRRAVLLKKHRPNKTGALTYGLIAVLAWIGFIRSWRAWRRGAESTSVDILDWLHWRSPLYKAAAMFAIEAWRPISREIQLGVTFSFTQIFGIVAVLILVSYPAMRLLFHFAEKCGTRVRESS